MELLFGLCEPYIILLNKKWLFKIKQICYPLSVIELVPFGPGVEAVAELMLLQDISPSSTKK